MLAGVAFAFRDTEADAGKARQRIKGHLKRAREQREVNKRTKERQREAAQRAGLSTVFIPQRNEADLDDVPADVLAALDVRPMTDVADIVALALVPAENSVTAAA